MASYRRRADEQRAFERVHWPGTMVYRNKLGIRDASDLERAERLLVAHRAEQGLPRAAHPLSYAGFRAIHHHLFQDLYDWAGEERPYTTDRGPITFALPEHIGSWMEAQFARLRAQHFLVGLSVDRFAEEAGAIVNEINAAHPFIDGNGRTQRTWLRSLADQAGFRLTLDGRDRDRWYEAARIGFDHGDPGPTIDLLRERLTPKKRGQL